MTTAQLRWDFRWDYLKSRRQPRRTATELYGRVVAWSREPWFYSDLGVPDTPEGRFEMVLLHTTLMLHRLKVEGPSGEPLARAVAEAFVTDMDDCLREMGVGDMTVAKKVKKAAAALLDRARDYGAALARPDDVGAYVKIATHQWLDERGVKTVAPPAARQSASETLEGHRRAAQLRLDRMQA